MMADVIETFADGTIVERDFTKAELKQIEIDKKNNETMEANILAKVAQRQAIADRIGLTADELKLLLG
jgi:hypothetical protein